MSRGENPVMGLNPVFATVAELAHEGKAIVAGTLSTTDHLSRDAIQTNLRTLAIGEEEVLHEAHTINDDDVPTDHPGFDLYDPSHPDLQNHPWLLGSRLVGYYMKRFAKAGVVDISYAEGHKQKWGYTLSDYGYDIALPIAGHQLDISNHADQSLIQIFGPPMPGPNGTRPWQRRISVLDLVAHGGKQTYGLTEVAASMSANQRVAAEIVRRMSKDDLLETSQQDKIDRVARYFVSPDITNVAVKSQASQVYIDIIDVLKMHGQRNPGRPIGNDEIERALATKYGLQPGDKRLQAAIAKRTNKMAQREDQILQKLPDDNEVTIWMNDRQHELADHLLEFTEGVIELNAEFLEDGREKLEQIIAEPEIVNYLLGKARDTSSGVKSLPRERREYQAAIQKITQDHPNPTTEQLDILMRQQGLELSKNALRRMLNQMGANNGVVRGPAKGHTKTDLAA